MATVNDILPGITFPDDGRRVYSESWDFEQEQKARAMAQRILDILSSGIQSGGEVTSGGGAIVQVGPTLAYDEEGKRVEVESTTSFTLTELGDFTIALRHAFVADEEVPDPDMHGTIVEHRVDFFEIVARTESEGLLSGDIPLQKVRYLGGEVELLEDIRQKRNLSISGDALIEGSLRVLGETTSIETVNQKIKDNIITLNDGETQSGVTARYSGYEVDRGTAENYRHVFDENLDRFVAGFEGSESPITRLADTFTEPTANEVPRYDESGCLKSSAPVSENDVARKSEIDTLESEMVNHTHDILKISYPEIAGESIQLFRTGNYLYWDCGDGAGFRPFA